MSKKKKILLIAISSIVLLGIIMFLGIYGVNKQILKTEYNEYSAIIKANKEYKKGEDFTFVYDFDEAKAKEVIERYDLNSIATTGTSYSKARRIMNYYSPRMPHQSSLDESFDYSKQSAIDLYDYVFVDGNGINCMIKSKIISECYLALGIKARRVWLMPDDITDDECHVDVEIFDEGYNKWILFDVTNNLIFTIDNVPLSAFELREAIKNDTDFNIEFDSPISLSEWYDSYREYTRSYYAKNTAYLVYEGITAYGVCNNTYATIMPLAYDIEAYSKKSGTKLIPIDSEECYK